MIEFHQAQVGYAENTLLNIPHATLKSGVFYAMIGKNGIGKSTLLQTMLGAQPLLSGTLNIQTHAIQQLSVKELARLVAFVPSKFDGVQHLTTQAYITMGRAPYTNFLGTYSPEDHAMVMKLMSDLKIAHLAERDTLTLSDGERQIASIAKALVQETPVIILDEPTAFLDYANRIAVLSLLKEITHSFNKCIIQSSHDLELCLEFSDELLLLANQKLTQIERVNFDKKSIIQQAYFNA